MTSTISVLPAVFSVVEEPAAGFVICRNGVVLKTPGGAWLTVSNTPLADAIVNELRSNNGKPDAVKTPLAMLAYTAIDVVGKNHKETIDQLAAYAGSELLCHRAEDPELAAEQQKVWQPLLDWCQDTFNAPLQTVAGIMPIEQPAKSVAALRRVIDVCDKFQLAGLSQAVTVSGSLIIGLAIAARRLDVDNAFAAAELDANYQMKKWGKDPVIEARHEEIKRDLAVCERWFRLLA